MALPSCLLLLLFSNDIAEVMITHKSILLDLVTKNETIKKKSILLYFGCLMELNIVIFFRV
jgi:hypothetical protein